MGTQKRLAIYVVRSPYDVPGIARLGPDPLDASFDVAALAAILTGARQQLKGLLRDQSVLAGVGNAYSDEVLHAAKLSPFRLGGSLSEAEVETLHTALIDVLTDALGRSRGVGPPPTSRREKKLALRVHGSHRSGVPGLRGHRARGGLRGLLAAVLPDVPDGGKAARRPGGCPAC
jgi:formamidopyrimidine-DNA glycosylase